MSMNPLQQHNRPAHIVYLITKSNWGGAQRYVYDVATGAQKQGFSVTVALGGNGELAVRLRRAGVPVYQLQSLVRDVGLLQEIRAFREIITLLKKERPDVFHINSSKAGIMGTLAGRLCGIPKIVFTAHGWAFNEDRPLWQRFILKCIHWLTVMLAHTTIAVSEMTKRQMNWPLAAKKMEVIYNGHSANELLSQNDARTQLAVLHHELSPHLHAPWSVSIGELHPTKQHDVMIRAMKEIVEIKPDTRHIIIGEGQTLVQLEKLVKDTNLEKNVFLLGNVPSASRYLKAFSFMVLPSRTEALPYVLLEACASGTPVIASSVGGIPEIIRHQEEGLLIAPGDVQGFTTACLHLLENEIARTKYVARTYERAEKFSINQMLQKTFTLYERQ